MRAAQTALRRPGLPMLRPAVERPHREHTPQTESGAALAFGVIFLAALIAGFCSIGFFLSSILFLLGFYPVVSFIIHAYVKKVNKKITKLTN